jgi:general L-amino acid transport system substrate-binding protein
MKQPHWPNVLPRLPRCLGLALAIFLVAGATTLSAATLDEVRSRGVLNCGVSEGLAGFSSRNADGTWSGFDVDYCRAVAAAVFGDPEKIAFVPLSATARFDALTSKKIDVLSRNTTWTMERDVLRGFEFIGVSYYDGQGFMTRRANGLSSTLQLGRASICVLDGTTAQTNAERYFERNAIKVEFKSFKDRSALIKAYDSGDCLAYSADRSGLASDRTRMRQPDEHMLLPEVISKEPLGPLVRDGDAQWADITRWVLFLLINAEEVGWTQHAASKPALATAISPETGASAAVGLDPAWFETVIKAVGNYGEIFARNIGQESPLGLDRGINALWNQGGILYAPPMR